MLKLKLMLINALEVLCIEHLCSFLTYTLSLPREVWVLRVLQRPLVCSPRKNGGAGGAVLKNK